MEEVVEFEGGHKQIVQRKVFPDYILVRYKMDDGPGTASAISPG